MKIIISGNPEPKARHRSFIRGKNIVSYDPQDNEKKIFAYRLRLKFKDFKEKFEKNKSFVVNTNFFIKVPDSYTEKKRNKCLWGIIKPRNCDTDNLVKFTWDCANGILWPDDRMIDGMAATKLYGENPCTEIIMSPQVEIDEDSEVAEILGLISPNEWKSLIQGAHSLMLFATITDEQELPQKFSNDKKHKIAEFLKEFSNAHAKLLCKIDKKFPEVKKVSGVGKTLC